MQSIEKKVIKKIKYTEKGWTFSPKDIASLGSRTAIDVTLHRLVEKGAIRRVMCGIYDSPRFSSLLGRESSPDIDQVARTLARKFGWRIQPSGAAALNLIGLSTQVPGKFVYLSDGPPRSYEIGEATLHFKKAALKESGFKLAESALMVQGIKALGAEHISSEVIEQLRNWLKPSLWAKVLKDTQRATGWVYEVIKKVCREDVDG